METRERWAPEGAADTPYMRARQEWDARMGNAIVQARNWRRAAFASLGLVLAALAGLVYLGAQPKAVPHIIEVDRLGNATYRGPAGERSAAYAPPEPVLKYHLRRFVEDTRSISSDLAVLKHNWLEAYNLVTPRGANMLTTYVQQPGHAPFERAKEERVGVEVLGLVRVSEDTWQIDWRETTFDRYGVQLGAPAEWRGMFRVLMQRPKDQQAMERNPLGLYVDEFHWDKVQS